jgi:hypothetical protein
MSDRNQEPSETAGPASGDDAATAEAAPAGGRVGGEPADGGQQQAEGVPPSDERGAEGQPVQDRAAGTERGSGDTTDRVSAEGGEAGEAGEGRTALFADEERDRLGEQWGAVQAAFVDDPRAAVERADALVAEVVQSLTTSFTDERSRLEQQWSQGEDVSTEDLRQALHRYRSFFDRLLHV